ncbi:Tesmin, partial [Nibea albiflora]
QGLYLNSDIDSCDRKDHFFKMMSSSDNIDRTVLKLKENIRNNLWKKLSPKSGRIDHLIQIKDSPSARGRDELVTQYGIDGHRTLGDKSGLAGKRDMGQEEDFRTGVLRIADGDIIHTVIDFLSYLKLKGGATELFYNGQSSPCDRARVRQISDTYCECFANGVMCNNCDCSNCHNNTEHEMKRHNAIKANIKCTSSCKCVGCRNYDDSSEMDIEEKTINVKDKSDRWPESVITPAVVEAVCGCLLAQAEKAERKAQSPVQAEYMVLDEFGRCLTQIVQAMFKN